MHDSTRRIIHHTLPPRLWERVSRYASERAMSTSDVIELSLERFLDSERERALENLLRSATVGRD